MNLFNTITNRYKMIFICLLSSMIFLQGCFSTETKNIEDYKYAVIYTNMFEKAVIHLYNEKGKFLSKHKTKYRGMPLGAFMERPIHMNNKVYYANPQSKYNTNEFILELNKNNLQIKEIPNEEKIAPTVWTVDKEFAYMSGGDLTSSDLAKTNIATGKQVASTELKGQAIHMIEHSDKLYVLTFIHSNPDDIYGIINVINKKDLSLIETIKIDDMMYSSDMELVDNDLFLVKTSDGKDNQSNELIKINLMNKKIEKITLPFKSLSDMHVHKDHIFITQGDMQREPTEKKIAKLHLNSSKIDVFTTEIENYVSYIHEDQFITSDGTKIQIYNLDNFKKEKEFKLEGDESLFTSFFIND